MCENDELNIKFVLLYDIIRSAHHRQQFWGQCIPSSLSCCCWGYQPSLKRSICLSLWRIFSRHSRRQPLGILLFCHLSIGSWPRFSICCPPWSCWWHRFCLGVIRSQQLSWRCWRCTCSCPWSTKRSRHCRLWVCRLQLFSRGRRLGSFGSISRQSSGWFCRRVLGWLVVGFWRRVGPRVWLPYRRTWRASWYRLCVHLGRGGWRLERGLVGWSGRRRWHPSRGRMGPTSCQWRVFWLQRALMRRRRTPLSSPRIRCFGRLSSSWSHRSLSRVPSSTIP